MQNKIVADRISAKVEEISKFELLYNHFLYLIKICVQLQDT